MELGGVSVPGKSPRTGGAYVAKDLSVFQKQLGGLTAFLMVSDGTADDESGGVAAQLAVKTADSYLERLLLDIASGKTPVVEPASTLKAIVAEANAALMAAAAEPGASSMGATFCGALISADRLWLGGIGDGRAYLLRGGEARELIVDSPRPEVAAEESTAGEGEAAERAQSDLTASSLGYAGVDVEVGAVDLIPGDAVVLLGQAASAVLSGSDVNELSCVACDAQVAAASLAEVAGKFEPDDSATVAVWSADSALFAPAPVPSSAPAVTVAAVDVPAPVLVANDSASWLSRGERIFLWVMAGWIAFVFVLLGVGMLVSGQASSENSSAVQTAPVAATSQGATVAVVPTETVVPEYPKKLIAPKNVKGGLWLRRMASTLPGTNEVAKLKGGAEVQAVAMTQGTDERGKTQDFYVFMVSDISKSQVVKDSAHPWPPKGVKKVYVFAGSLEPSK